MHAESAVILACATELVPLAHSPGHGTGHVDDVDGPDGLFVVTICAELACRHSHRLAHVSHAVSCCAGRQ